MAKVQHRATKMAHSIRSLPYEARCAALGLTSLETRRTRGDLIQMFKIVKGLDIVNWHHPPVCGQPRTGHRGQYRREIVPHCLPRHMFLSNRVAGPWNALPDSIVDAPSVDAFKQRLDAHDKSCNSASRTQFGSQGTPSPDDIFCCRA